LTLDVGAEIVMVAFVRDAFARDAFARDAFVRDAFAVPCFRFRQSAAMCPFVRAQMFLISRFDGIWRIQLGRVSVEVEVVGIVEEVGILACLRFFLLLSLVEGFTSVEGLILSPSFSFNCRMLRLALKSVQ
jgi:hypothetical protein